MTIPFLAVHGLNDAPHTWNGMAGRGLEVRAVSMPWSTDTPASAWTFDDVHDAVHHAVSAQVASTPYWLMGHSLGAAAVLLLVSSGAIRPPQGLVLICPTYVQRDEVRRSDTKAAHRKRFDLVFTERVRLDSAASKPVTEQMASILLRAVTDKERGQVLGFVERLGSADLEGIGVPSLVISGSEDAGTTPQQSEELRARLHRVTAYIGEGWGHFCHRQYPEEVTALVRQWVRSVPQQAPPPALTWKGHL